MKLSSIVQFIFFLVKVSEAAVKTAISLTFVLSAYSSPFKLGTNALKIALFFNLSGISTFYKISDELDI